MIIGIALLVIGLVALAVKLDIIQGSIWGWVWPLLLILAGLMFLARRRRWGGWCCSSWREQDENKP
ncbi:MAG: hypothetical protein HY673_04335 [Chloroflexi bacterium]|nr:hypothetical protein [Chloroflexota bacterium]